MRLFFDTYALIEILKNNPNYEKYKDFDLNTSILNISEFYYFLLRTSDKKEADHILKKLNLKLINIIQVDTALKASNFKFENRKQKLSYIDCIGYFLAQRMNLNFLTGDEKFKNKENVEFVK